MAKGRRRSARRGAAGAAPRRLAATLLAWCVLASCGESLPTRIVPENTLEIVDVYAGQGTAGGSFRVAVTIVVENVYEETFSGDVDVVGNLHFSWVEHPEIEANVAVRDIERLRLDPGERYHIVRNWDLVTDDGQSIMELLDWSDNDIRHGVHYARPEHFILDVTLTLYREVGLLKAEPHQFSIQVWKLAAPSG